jgi:ABC-type molybdate transport system substrate-binding protein
MIVSLWSRVAPLLIIPTLACAVGQADAAVAIRVFAAPSLTNAPADIFFSANEAKMDGLEKGAGAEWDSEKPSFQSIGHCRGH